MCPPRLSARFARIGQRPCHAHPSRQRLQLAEDAVQDAFTAAVQTWRGTGANEFSGLAHDRGAAPRDRPSAARQAQADRADRLAELARLDAQENDAVTEASMVAMTA